MFKSTLSLVQTPKQKQELLLSRSREADVTAAVPVFFLGVNDGARSEAKQNRKVKTVAKSRDKSPGSPQCLFLYRILILYRILLLYRIFPIIRTETQTTSP